MDETNAILKFCMKHPEVDVSFHADNWNCDFDQVKINMTATIRGGMYRCSRVVAVGLDRVSPVLEDMWLEISKFADTEQGIKRRKRKAV